MIVLVPRPISPATIDATDRACSISGFPVRIDLPAHANCQLKGTPNFSGVTWSQCAACQFKQITVCTFDFLRFGHSQFPEYAFTPETYKL